MKKYDKFLMEIGAKRISELEELADGNEVKVAGILTKIKKIQTKVKAETMAYITLEDPEDNVEVVVFPEIYRHSLKFLQKDTPLLVKGVWIKQKRALK